MKLIALLVILFLSFSLHAEVRCDINFPSTNQCAQINWTYGPFEDQLNSFIITIDNKSVVKTIKVIPWMVMSEGHAHGGRSVKMTTIGDLEFNIENAYFMGGMNGSWYLKVQLMDSSSKIIDEARYLVNLKK